MSALTIYQGLEVRFRTIPGLANILLGEPTGVQETPALYTVYQQFDRPLRNSPPAQNLTGMTHLFAHRLVLQFVDNPQCEMQLLAFLDAIPDSVDLDPHLGGRLTKGMAFIGSGITGFATIGAVQYRIVDYLGTVLEKRTGN